MRPIELILCMLVIFSAVVHLLPRVPAVLKFCWAPGLLLLTSAAQVVLEGFRWQLWPVAVGVTLLVLVGVLRWARKTESGRPWAAAVLAGLLAGLSLALGWVLPVPEPFPPSGPYPVGTTVFSLVDDGRTELYGADPTAPREIMVQVWYPADQTDQREKARFMPDIEYAGPALAEWIEIPSFALNHLRYAQANAYLDAPVMEGGGRLPLLVFSHGWSGFREQNIYQVEDLASHGYVVAAISHTYGAVLTVFPDGRQMPRNDAALPEGVSQDEYDQASNRLVRQWAGDIGFVLDELARREDADGWFLAGRLDFDQVGVLGHSTGGGAAAEFCGSDPRCRAALMMDLWVEPVSDSVVENGLAVPFLMMHSAAWADLENPSENFRLLGELAAASSGEVIEIRIEGSEHHDFSALPLLTPLASTFGLKGPIDGETGLALINYYTLAFFDQFLRGVDQDLLDPENAPFAEAQFGLRGP